MFFVLYCDQSWAILLLNVFSIDLVCSFGDFFVILLIVLYIKSPGRFFMGSSLMSSVISRILASIRPLHGRPIVKHSFALLGNKPVEPAQSGGGALYWNVIAWVMWIQLIIWRLIGHQILSPYQTGIYETLLDAH